MDHLASNTDFNQKNIFSKKFNIFRDLYSHLISEFQTHLTLVNGLFEISHFKQSRHAKSRNISLVQNLLKRDSEYFNV